VRSRLLVTLVAGACALGLPHRSRAAEADERAAVSFQEGREAMRQGHYATACGKFRESQSLDPSPGTVLNLAVCEERLGHLIRARSLVQRFSETAAASDDRRAYAEQMSKDLEERSPRLSIRIDPANVSATEVKVDGLELSSYNDPLVLDPGRHEIEVSSPGCIQQRIVVELVEKQQVEKDIHLAPRSAPPSTSAVREHPGGNASLPALFYAALGTGIAGALTVMETGVITSIDRSTVKEHCVDKQCDEAGLAAGKRGKLFSTVNTVAWPIAIAGTSLAGYLLFTKKPQGDPKYAVGVSVSAGQTALILQGTLQ
jgi:hypothetical protein